MTDNENIPPDIQEFQKKVSSDRVSMPLKYLLPHSVFRAKSPAGIIPELFVYFGQQRSINSIHKILIGSAVRCSPTYGRSKFQEFDLKTIVEVVSAPIGFKTVSRRKISTCFNEEDSLVQCPHCDVMLDEASIWAVERQYVTYEIGFRDTNLDTLYVSSGDSDVVDSSDLWLLCGKCWQEFDPPSNLRFEWW